MFLAKNLLIGLGSAGIIGAGGYGIYSATRSSKNDITDNKETVNLDSEGNSGEPTLPAGSQSKSEGAQSKGFTDSTGVNGGTVGSKTTTAGDEQAPGSPSGLAGGNEGRQGTSA